MKIGIVSIHYAHNYGSALQAYALQKVLENYSKSVEIIDYRPKYFRRMYKIFSLSIYKEYSGFLNKMVHLGWRVVFLPQRINKARKFSRFMRDHFRLTDKKYLSEKDINRGSFDYDVVFVGSDQVWNTDITNGYDGVFFLDFLTSKTYKASYAASIAKETVDKRYRNRMIESLSSFDKISVREEEGKELLSQLLNKKIEVSIDPTLLLDSTEWDKIAQNSTSKVGGDYIFVYILQDNPEIVKIINYLSEKCHLPVVSIGKKKRFRGEKVYRSAGPEDFVNLIKGARYVVTNSFHGTAFSVIYKKECFIVPHLTTGNRMISLLRKIGLEQRIVKEFDREKICRMIEKKPNFKGAYSILEKEKKLSNMYISNIIKETKGE